MEVGDVGAESKAVYAQTAGVEEVEEVDDLAYPLGSHRLRFHH